MIATPPRRWSDIRWAAVAFAGASCFLLDARAEPCASRNPSAAVATSFARDSDAARTALRVWCSQILERPRRYPRLFVEAYAMRGLVAANAVLDEDARFDPRDGLASAVDYADSLVLRQSFLGYWPLGYHAQFWADMATAVALFPALEPFVDPDRSKKYEAAAERFMKGLGRDHMLLAEGAVGIGRVIVVDPLRQNRRDHRPYLVSTALAGISVRAWLYHRTHQEPYRVDALAALDYTLSKIAPDGFEDEQAKKEGALRTAAYVQEGWMAADAWLEDPEVERRLRQALPAHVAWLLRVQRPDGTWTSEREDETTRTPPIVNFLVWYDQRFGPCEDVRDAVRRASAAYTCPTAAWDRDGEHYEVMRALAGRALAALASDRYVIP